MYCSLTSEKSIYLTATVGLVLRRPITWKENVVVPSIQNNWDLSTRLIVLHYAILSTKLEQGLTTVVALHCRSVIHIKSTQTESCFQVYY